jgi:ABC-type lipoprotein release transport system permease subunit
MKKLILQFFLQILVCMLGLAFIVANSLITNNLEEKTYENAMLRTLGWDKSNIVLVTLIKTTIYFIIPGFIIAILLLYGLSFLIKNAIEDALRR